VAVVDFKVRLSHVIFHAFTIFEIDFTAEIPKVISGEGKFRVSQILLFQ
jgi:hypothetical protein